MRNVIGKKEKKRYNSARSFILITLIFFLLSETSCGKEKTDRLLVASASSLQFPLKKIIEKFTNKYGYPVELLVDASGKHVARIENGAPYHVFISADESYPLALKRKGKTTDDFTLFAHGRLIFYSPGIKNMQHDRASLLNKQLRQIALADPVFAPYGRAALEYLKNNGLFESLEKQLIYGTSIAQINGYLHSRVVDGVLTAFGSDLAHFDADFGEFSTVVDKKFYGRIDYTAVLIKTDNLEQMKRGRHLIKFLTMPEARDILEKHGFGVPVTN